MIVQLDSLNSRAHSSRVYINRVLTALSFNRVSILLILNISWGRTLIEYWNVDM